jgi:YidC/Oxa1 family membrane protein insertase
MMMSTPTMDKTQQRLMLLLPLFFVLFIIRFPAGLILYWITTNAWTMGQQYIIRRTMAPVVPPGGTGPSVDGGKGGGGSGPDGGAPSNGAAATGGFSGALRGLLKPPESKEPAGVASPRPRRETAPPPPPRKKKKRSGRRR